MAVAQNRAANEARMMARQSVPGVTITQSEQDYRHFFAKIEGPPGTPFEGGSFPVEVFCP